MKLKINNLDLPFTIDTYGTFVMDSEESTLEWLNEPEQLKEYPGYDEITSDDIDWEYDHEGYVEWLAKKSIEYIEDYLVMPNDPDTIINSITYVKSGSPSYYNYTTDWYVAEWDINPEQLDMYIATEGDKFPMFIKSKWQYEWDKAREEDDLDTQLIIKLDFYVRDEYDDEDYMMSMYEHAGGHEFTDYKVRPKEA